MTDRQREVQDIAGPIIEEMAARLHRAGLTGPEAAQALILHGAGMLARSLGPKGAGHAMHHVADKAAAWMRDVGDTLDKRDNH